MVREQRPAVLLFVAVLHAPARDHWPRRAKDYGRRKHGPTSPHKGRQSEGSTINKAPAAPVAQRQTKRNGMVRRIHSIHEMCIIHKRVVTPD